MRPPRRKAVVAVAVLAVGFLLLSGPLSDGGSQPADLEPYPEPPGQLTNESAKEAAYQHERAYVDRQLANASEVQSYALGSTVAGGERTVLVQNDTGIYVRVRHGYGYSTRSADTDGLTNTTYFVNESAIVVVERHRGVYV